MKDVVNNHFSVFSGFGRSPHIKYTDEMHENGYPRGARGVSQIANICEKDMSFVTTPCVAGRIVDHGGYVEFRT
jgi:hypothetical protein